MKYFLIVAIFILSWGKVAAQSEFEPKGSFKIDLQLPNNMSNKAFRELMQGLAAVTPSFQYTFSNSLAIGGGFRYGYFNVNQFKNYASLSGGLHNVSAFLKIGQEKFYGKFGLDYGLRAGYGMDFFTTNLNKQKLGKPFMDNALFIEPHINFVLLSSDNSSFCFSVGYAFVPNQFRPEQVGLDDFSGMDLSKLSKLTSYLSVGFGYSYYFGKKTTD